MTANPYIKVCNTIATSFCLAWTGTRKHLASHLETSIPKRSSACPFKPRWQRVVPTTSGRIRIHPIVITHCHRQRRFTKRRLCPRNAFRVGCNNESSCYLFGWLSSLPRSLINPTVVSDYHQTGQSCLDAVWILHMAVFCLQLVGMTERYLFGYDAAGVRLPVKVEPARMLTLSSDVCWTNCEDDDHNLELSCQAPCTSCNCARILES